MEPQMIPQTTLQSSSPSSSSSPPSPCSCSSSSSPSSFYVDGARLVPFPFLSPNRNESQLAAGISIERLRFIDRMAHGGMEWKDVEERFNRLASTTAGSVPVVNRSDFAFCIGMEETPEFAEELLESLEGRSSNRDDRQLEITKPQFHEYWIRITDPSFNSRIRIFFDLFDRNKDGKITEMEIKQVMLLSASSNKLSMTQEEAEDYCTLIMEELDTSKRGFIEISQLQRLFFTESQIAVSSQCNIPGNQNHKMIRTPSIEEIYLRTYWRRSWIIGLWLTICMTLFSWKFIQYSHRNSFQCAGYCIPTAKGAAETLKFNMALILLPVCRNTVTWLRMNRRINSIIPFNDNINFHKLIAGGIVVGVILHAGAHLICDFPRIASCNHLVFRRTIAGCFGGDQPSYMEILGSPEVLIGIAIVVLMAIAFTLATPLSRRRSSSLPWPLRQVTGFNTFWYSHHLFIIVYALLIVHSLLLFLTHDVREKTTWMYIAFPVLLYLYERIFRAIRSGLYHVEVLEAKTYAGKVLSLKLSKPEDFNYRSGMYIFIQCPQISSFEWHPFSLTSAPEDNYINVHIRTQGDWSYQMYSLFQEALAPVGSGFPKIYIDGPYGAASQDHIKYDVIVLIGLGIGATPFISILKDVVHGLRKPNVDYEDGGESGITNTKGPSKAYLYWVTREQSSFEWFRDVIKEVSHANRKQDVVEIHNFLTSVYEDGDARSALISAIQALYHAKKGIDIVSKTPVRTHFARPNWTKVFSNLARSHEGERIGVFYCGHSALARELERLCTKLTTKTTTRFVFHKENY
ncbi:hypothetical protein NE237_007349 [Protea cynaroides]|uniref:Uncharacterized protein n=1 Tax=Protea cynaroides TaxID=273540 RepID=A0A9Q0QWD0_9MAGN|nr:hypothetical protein NE237_007349 [Protea cynaroides]